MEELFVIVVVAVMLSVAGVSVYHYLRDKSSVSSLRLWTIPMILVQILILVSDLLIGNQTVLRLPFDLLLSAIGLSLFTLNIIPDKKKKIILYIYLLLGSLLTLFYILCAFKLFPAPSGSLIMFLSAILFISYICTILYYLWQKLKDVHELMSATSVWAWLNLAVDVFYTLSLVILVTLSYLFSSSSWVMASLTILMTGLVVAFMCRINSDSAFAFLHRHERTIIESMKISSADSVSPGSGEDQMYKEVFGRIQRYFEEDKPYLNGDLTINHVAEEVFSNRVYISRAISHCTGRNFCQYVNYHRIMHAIECYRNNVSLKVSELWPLCGFNTSVSFSMAFRLFMNENPSDWCRKEKMKICRKRK